MDAITNALSNKPYEVGHYDTTPGCFYIQLKKTDPEQPDQPYHWTEEDFHIACGNRFVEVLDGRLRPHHQ